MQELLITPSTLAFLGIIFVLAALAVHRLTRKGMCDRNDHCSGSCHSGKSGCSCSAVDDMVSKMEAAVKNERSHCIRDDRSNEVDHGASSSTYARPACRRTTVW